MLAEEERESVDEEWALGSETPRARAPKQGSLGFSVVGFLSAPGEQAQLGVFVSDIVPGGVAHRFSPSPLPLSPALALAVSVHPPIARVPHSLPSLAPSRTLLYHSRIEFYTIIYLHVLFSLP